MANGEGFSSDQRYEIDRAIRAAETVCRYEFSVYVGRSHRGRGVGRVLLIALIDEAERLGFWKLVSRIFPENAASRGLCRAMGFREVGVYEKHGKLDGVWKDCVIVERLIPANLD